MAPYSLVDPRRLACRGEEEEEKAPSERGAFFMAATKRRKRTANALVLFQAANGSAPRR